MQIQKMFASDIPSWRAGEGDGDGDGGMRTRLSLFCAVLGVEGPWGAWGYGAALFRLFQRAPNAPVKIFLFPGGSSEAKRFCRAPIGAFPEANHFALPLLEGPERQSKRVLALPQDLERQRNLVSKSRTVGVGNQKRLRVADDSSEVNEWLGASPGRLTLASRFAG